MSNLFAPSKKTLHVTLLVLPNCSMMCLACVLDVMRTANRLAHTPLFSWRLTSFDGQPLTLSCGVTLTPDDAFHNDLQGDMLIILSGFHQKKQVNQERLDLLKSALTRFKMVGGMESGSWILARMGQLDHRKAATHWEELETFAMTFPQIRAESGRYIIEDHVFTAGGATPSFDFMLHLIRQRHSQQLALQVARVFTDKDADAPPTQHQQPNSTCEYRPNPADNLLLGSEGGREPRVAQAIRLMETHLATPLSLQELARCLKLSVRTLDYLFSQATPFSPGQYYLHLRLQTARRLVMDTRLPMHEIARRTGFGSQAAFSRQFKKHFTLTPRDCRKVGGR